MICKNCEAEVGDNEKYCCECGQKLVEDLEIKNSHNVKNFILTCGRWLIDFDTKIWLSLIVLLAFCLAITSFACFIPNEAHFFEYVLYAPAVYLCALIIPLLLLIILIFVKYFVYLAIDIKDSLNAINNKTKEGN